MAIIGGYTMETDGNGAFVTVRQYESGWSFFLQGDDAVQFLDDWDAYQSNVDDAFDDFLDTYDYAQLLH